MFFWVAGLLGCVRVSSPNCCIYILIRNCCCSVLLMQLQQRAKFGETRPYILKRSWKQGFVFKHINQFPGKLCVKRLSPYQGIPGNIHFMISPILFTNCAFLLQGHTPSAAGTLCCETGWLIIFVVVVICVLFSNDLQLLVVRYANKAPHHRLVRKLLDALHMLLRSNFRESINLLQGHRIQREREGAAALAAKKKKKLP